MNTYDIIIIGGGIIGCSIARELSRFSASVLVLDKESDVCEGTSKANSAIIHGGFDAKPGTLKAKFNLQGNLMMDRLSSELDFSFRRNGALVVCWGENGLETLEMLKARGEKNGVEKLQILNREEALKIEPNLADGVYAALYVPTSGIVCPFEMTIAYAENAVANGAVFQLSTEVKRITKDKDGIFHIFTNAGEYNAKCMINCAGVYADQIHNMVCEPSFTITARKGEYMLLDKTAGDLIQHTIFQTPTSMGKGVLVTPTIHGNLLIGPTALDIDDKEDTATTFKGLEAVQGKSELSVKGIPLKQVITSFSGLRATGDTGDFVIREDPKVKNFIDVACIESPGLSSAPAIALYVRDLVKDLISLSEKDDFHPERKGIRKLSQMSFEERKTLIAEHPEYGQIICRCEQISEGEILDSIRRPLGATTLDGVKRRVRAGMGRCQAGFCSPKVIEILSRELNIPYGEVKKNG